MPGIRGPVSERFWSKVHKGEGDACWLWTGWRNNKGYAMFSVGSGPGHNKLAHRVAWELLNGPIPEGVYLCHHCDNPGCVRPGHQFLGTQSDNMRDASHKGRMRETWARYREHPERSPHAKLTLDQVRSIRARYDAGDHAITSLGAEYGVTPGNIWLVATRKTYKSI